MADEENLIDSDSGPQYSGGDGESEVCQSSHIANQTPAGLVNRHLGARHIVRDHDDISFTAYPVLNTRTILQATQPPESDNVVAVFVVAFDTKAGNVIEWQLPEDIDLSTIEFKAMASGSHTLKSDFVYFVKGGLYGLACFENATVDNTSERGARMKSVGVMSTNFAALWQHYSFLKEQVRNQLDMPGSYEPLRTFWNENKAILHATGFLTDSIDASREAISPLVQTNSVNSQLRHCFSEFMQLFGDKMFILWRLALLRKRILFFSPPPIGIICCRVYVLFCMANHTKHKLLGTGGQVRPHFHVNVADIDTLTSDVSYIACTTEKIFETKSHLYDVYIDKDRIMITSNRLRSLLHVNNADRSKFDNLVQLREQSDEQSIEGYDDNELFIKYFTELNNRLFETLIDLSTSDDRLLDTDHMRSMQLDPVEDREFVLELLNTFGIDVTYVSDKPCCHNLCSDNNPGCLSIFSRPEF